MPLCMGVELVRNVSILVTIISIRLLSNDGEWVSHKLINGRARRSATATNDILKMVRRTSITQLFFLGLLSYYHDFCEYYKTTGMILRV